MKWTFLKGVTNMQVDTVGNIVQKAGGVIPKACQKCKKEFTGKIESVPIKQKVPFYKCTDCEFISSSGDAAFDHKILTDHKLSKIVKDRIVGTENKIIGNFAKISKTKNDVIILCDDCYGIV